MWWFSFFPWFGVGRRPYSNFLASWYESVRAVFQPSRQVLRSDGAPSRLRFCWGFHSLSLPKVLIMMRVLIMLVIVIITLSISIAIATNLFLRSGCSSSTAVRGLYNSLNYPGKAQLTFSRAEHVGNVFQQPLSNELFCKVKVWYWVHLPGLFSICPFLLMSYCLRSLMTEPSTTVAGAFEVAPVTLFENEITLNNWQKTLSHLLLAFVITCLCICVWYRLTAMTRVEVRTRDSTHCHRH